MYYNNIDPVNLPSIKKSSLLSISILMLFVLGCDHQNTKTPFKKALRSTNTSIKGSVYNWPTDTVYFATFTFHSTYSTVEGYQILSPDKTFELNKNNVDKTFVLFLTPDDGILSRTILGEARRETLLVY